MKESKLFTNELGSAVMTAPDETTPTASLVKDNCYEVSNEDNVGGNGETDGEDDDRFPKSVEEENPDASGHFVV